MRVCNICLESKNLDQYSKDAQVKDGLSRHCKECRKKKYKKALDKDPQCYIRYAKKYRESNRKLINDRAKESYHVDTEKWKTTAKKSYQKNKDKIAEKNRIVREDPGFLEKNRVACKKWRTKNIEVYRKFIKVWRVNNREKLSAHSKVKRAVANGLLIRSLICEQCKTDKGIMEGHHEDYSKPLEVQWLCKLCHGNKRKKHR